MGEPKDEGQRALLQSVSWGGTQGVAEGSIHNPHLRHEKVSILLRLCIRRSRRQDWHDGARALHLRTQQCKEGPA
jgi:hypothetical protein